MSGNVREWMNDSFDATGPGSGLVRGSCFEDSKADQLWSSRRLKANRDVRNHFTGFRIVLEERRVDNSEVNAPPRNDSAKK
jgi:formylglycine-generating enzyme required for sulfatase activity